MAGVPVSAENVSNTPAAPATPPDSAGVWAAMSHEIRTPLMGVVGMLEILSHTTLTDDQRRLIATVGESSATLMRLIDDVLDLAKLESGRLALDVKPADLGDLLEGCTEIIAGQAEAKGLTIACEVLSELPPVLCDGLRLRQVLLNLGVNAIKFTESGHVTLTVEAATVTADRAGVRFTIADTGIGIPEHLHAFLFQPFSQLGATAAQGHGGVGLGLAICRNLVDAMAGEITVESALGQGTRFHVDLAFPRAIQGRAENAGFAQRRLDGMKIVAVDAGEPAMQMAVRYIEGAGAHVERVKGLNDLAALGARPSLEGDGAPVVIVGPSAELEDVEAAAAALRRNNSPSALSVLWLHPGAVGGASALARRGLRGVRAHPLRRAALLDAVAGAPSNVATPAQGHLPSGGAGAPPFELSDIEAAARARADGRVILVAEDNVVNQQVLRQQLAILGFDCDIAANGAAALEALQARSYGLLLCDCQMPGIDGFELTRTIRMNEKTTGAHLPIVAVTANVISGEAERCRAVGMDDFLSKPIEIKRLQAALGRWLDVKFGLRAGDGALPIRPPGIRDAGAGHLGNDSSSAIDLRKILALFGNDAARLMPVLAQWRSVMGDAAQDLRRAIAARDWVGALASLHRVSGSAGVAGAYGLSAAAATLERQLRAGDVQAISMDGVRVINLIEDARREIENWSAQAAKSMGGNNPIKSVHAHAAVSETAVPSGVSI